MDDTLQFLVMVQTARDRHQVLGLVLNCFPDAMPRKPNSCDLRGNWIEVRDNDGADFDLAKDDEKGYLHFDWRVEVTPLSAKTSESEQIQLAREMKACFEAAECRAVVCANFEDRI